MSAATPHAAAYAEQRARDWDDFAARSGPLPDYWAEWARRSHGWRVPVQFLQPLGMDYPAWIEQLAPLRAALVQLDELDLVPPQWLHLTTAHVGFLMASDILWSQVESFYANAAPRIHRIAPFTLRPVGVSVWEDGVYLGVDDGLALREVRRQASLGVPLVREALLAQGSITAEGDSFVPRIALGFFTGRGGAGARRRVLAAIAPYRELSTAELPVTHIKLVRLPVQPHDHYAVIDVVAEIALYGQRYREGYHN